MIFFEKAFVNRCKIRKDPFSTMNQESFDAIAKGRSRAMLNLYFLMLLETYTKDIPIELGYQSEVMRGSALRLFLTFYY